LADLGLLKLLLPDYFVDYFEVIDYKSEGDELHLFVEEKNNPPQEYAKDKLSSKGFHDEVVFQDNSQYGFFFIFMACIRLPHVVSMQGLYTKKIPNNSEDNYSKLFTLTTNFYTSFLCGVGGVYLDSAKASLDINFSPKS
jgi:hypothetical protein